MDEQLGRLVRAFEQRAGGPTRDRGRRRPRRGARRPRGVPAREPRLPGHDARSPPARGAGPRAGRERLAGQHPAGLPHDPGLGRPRSGGQPSRRGAGGRPRRGHEAVPLLRVAASGDGRRGPDEGDPRGKAGGLRRRRRSGGDPRPRGHRRACRGRPAPPCATTRSRRSRRSAPRTTSARKSAGSSRASATSARGRRPSVRKDAPRPVDMAPSVRRSSTRRPRSSSTEQYARVIPLLEKILAEDPSNLDAALRLATAHSALGPRGAGPRRVREGRGDRSRLPGRPHLPRAALRPRTAVGEGRRPCSSRSSPRRRTGCPPLEALAQVRERQGRLEEALALRQKVYARAHAVAGGARPAGRSWR